MAKCFKIVAHGVSPFNQAGQHVQDNGARYPGWIRANTVTVVTDVVRSTDPNPYYTGCLAAFLIIDGVDRREWQTDWEISEDPNNPNCPADPNPPSENDKPHDCINGACTRKTVYNTPGLYATKAECQVVCGTKGCSGQCISNSDWAQIEGLSNQLKNRNCS